MSTAYRTFEEPAEAADAGLAKHRSFDPASPQRALPSATELVMTL
jgi:hypothetical protein